MDKQLITVEPVDGGWRVLARQDIETMYQVTVVPTKTKARDIADGLEITIALAVTEALRAVLSRSLGASALGK